MRSFESFPTFQPNEENIQQSTEKPIITEAEKTAEKIAAEKITDLFRDPLIAIHSIKNVENISRIIEQGIISKKFAERVKKQDPEKIQYKQNVSHTQEKYGEDLISVIGNLYRKPKKTFNDKHFEFDFRNPDNAKEENIFDALSNMDRNSGGDVRKDYGVIFNFNINEIGYAPSQYELMLKNRIAPRQTIGMFFHTYIEEIEKEKLQKICQEQRIPLYEIYQENYFIDPKTGEKIEGNPILSRKYLESLLVQDLSIIAKNPKARKSLKERAELLQEILRKSPQQETDRLWENEEDIQQIIEKIAKEKNPNDDDLLWNMQRIWSYIKKAARDNLWPKMNYRTIWPPATEQNLPEKTLELKTPSQEDLKSLSDRMEKKADELLEITSSN